VSDPGIIFYNIDFFGEKHYTFSTLQPMKQIGMQAGGAPNQKCIKESLEEYMEVFSDNRVGPQPDCLFEPLKLA
jgi:hypothetical protein